MCLFVLYFECIHIQIDIREKQAKSLSLLRPVVGDSAHAIETPCVFLSVDTAGSSSQEKLPDDLIR
jgi:hypothetical protein